MRYHDYLQKHLRRGSLTLHLPDGLRRYGDGEPHADWIIRHPDTLKRIARDPELMLGETYMQGDWDVPDGKLLELLHVIMLNFPEPDKHWDGPIQFLKNLLRRGNRVAQSYRNVAHHYNLDEWLFRHFLDSDMQYSCAYFQEPDMNLEEAQRAKCRHIMNKLLLRPGQHVLDIGCGWGGLALFLAAQTGVKVTGLTLSSEQLRVARQRASASGLEHSVEFRLQDYREHTGKYDRIVSVGMFEHVGVNYYDCFFQKISQLLRADGVTLLHTIGRTGPPGETNPWIEKYIFPGGYNPALSEVSRAIEASGLVSCDIEILRLHYARTLAAWQQRFQARRAEITERMGERFCRMWELYLVICEAAFRWRSLAIFQIQLTHSVDVAPLTRAYLYPATGKLKQDNSFIDASER